MPQLEARLPVESTPSNQTISQHSKHTVIWRQMVVQNFEGNSAYAMYISFSVGELASKYILSVSAYNGTAGDSLTSTANMCNHSGYQFSTMDEDNDRCTCNCAQTYKGAWWYNLCHDSNLNGLYHGGAHSSHADGTHGKNITTPSDSPRSN